MCVIHFFAIILLLCNGCFAVTSDSDSDSLAEPTAEQEFINRLILVENEPEIYSLAFSDLFRHQYEFYEVQIYAGNVLEFYGKEHRLSINNETEVIHIADLNLALRVLQRFGNDISRLYIGREFSKDILESVTSPLEWVKHLRVDLSQSSSNILPFGQLFPQLNRLSLRLEGDIDYSFIDCELSNLQHLDISITSEAWKRKDQIEGMLWQNQHIESVEFSGFPMDYIKNINAMLPNVFNLTLHGFDTGQKMVHLENVKHLTLYGSSLERGSPGSIENLICPQLRYLEFFYWSSDYNAWKTFFQNHQQLEMLYLREGSTQNYKISQDCVQLIRMISMLPNLIEFKMHQTNPIIIEAIQNFVENHQKLRMIHFVPVAGNNDIAVYRENVEDEWSILCFTDNQVLFAGEFPEFQKILEREMKH